MVEADYRYLDTTRAPSKVRFEIPDPCSTSSQNMIMLQRGMPFKEAVRMLAMFFVERVKSRSPLITSNTGAIMYDGSDSGRRMLEKRTKWVLFFIHRCQQERTPDRGK